VGRKEAVNIIRTATSTQVVCPHCGRVVWSQEGDMTDEQVDEWLLAISGHVRECEGRQPAE
jgi:predicted transcriptional regulator